MRPFDYASAATLDEALSLLGGNGGGTCPLAGGTDLLTLMKADLATPDRLVDIKRVAELDDRIELETEGLAIGALATLAQIEDDRLIREIAPALTEAAAIAATPQLRNMATIGGNLLQRPRCWYFRNPHIDCWLKGGDDCPAREGENQLHALFGGGPCVAVHPSDLATALVAHDARIRVRGSDGARTLPLEQFFAQPEDGRRTENVLDPTELVTEVLIPHPPEGARGAYLKAMDRKVWAFALVGVATMVAVDAGRITAARIVLGGVAPIPWRRQAAEQALIGFEPGEDLFARVAEIALADATPLNHNEYKVSLARTLVRRALAAALDTGGGMSVDQGKR